MIYGCLRRLLVVTGASYCTSTPESQALRNASVLAMKTDVDGFLDIKLAIVATQPDAWLAAVASLGDVASEQQNGEWVVREVRTAATVGDRTLRVLAYVGAPTADVRVGFIGADRVVSDGTTEVPDVSLADVPRVAGPPTKETLQQALKETLKAAKG